MKKIAVFASGNGTNFQAIIDAVSAGKVNEGEVCILVCDNPKAFCLQRAKKAGIKTVMIERKNFDTKKEFEKEISKSLKKEKIDLICLAGFMRVLSADFIKEYRNRILNIHPALLPSFRGARAIKDALTCGVKITGATVHFVTEELDSGPIIIQKAIRISPEDTEETLFKKMHSQEHEIYPRAIDLFCRGKLKIIGRKVKILE